MVSLYFNGIIYWIYNQFYLFLLLLFVVYLWIINIKNFSCVFIDIFTFIKWIMSINNGHCTDFLVQNSIFFTATAYAAYEKKFESFSNRIHAVLMRYTAYIFFHQNFFNLLLILHQKFFFLVDRFKYQMINVFVFYVNRDLLNK